MPAPSYDAARRRLGPARRLRQRPRQRQFQPCADGRRGAVRAGPARGGDAVDRALPSAPVAPRAGRASRFALRLWREALGRRRQLCRVERAFSPRNCRRRRGRRCSIGGHRASRPASRRRRRMASSASAMPCARSIGGETPARRRELGDALASWAASYRELPSAAAGAAPALPPREAIAAIPVVPPAAAPPRQHRRGAGRAGRFSRVRAGDRPRRSRGRHRPRCWPS